MNQYFLLYVANNTNKNIHTTSRNLSFSIITKSINISMVKHITQMRKYIYIIYMAENKYKTITYDRYRNLFMTLYIN